MPVQNLLDINPDKLFEDKTISEIEDVQKKLQGEIERKREELRTMVGEKYRDLIEAADTIRDMKFTAERVISHIDRMSEKCLQLQQRHLLGFKNDMDHSKHARSSTAKECYSVAMQIKILVDIPEQIWSAAEKKDFLLSTQLFLLARHIDTGLQLNVGSNDNSFGSHITEWFPVISHQWSMTSRFHSTIVTGCEKMLEDHDLSPEVASSCLSALVLLKGITSLQLLEKLLRLRTQALERIMKSDDLSVKSRICRGLNLLIHTISLLHTCFIEASPNMLQPEGLVLKQLKSIVGREASPSLLLVDLKDVSAAKFLPPLVRDFRPSTAEPVTPVPPADVRDSVSRWLQWVSEFVQREVATLLTLIGSLRGLHSIREETAGLVVTTARWDTVCQHLMIPHTLDFWSSYFQPLLTTRAKQIVTQHWESALNRVKALLKEAVSTHRSGQPEHDLRWYVWKESSTDLPHGSNHNNGLAMKAKGYSPCVQNLCQGLNTQLDILLEDLQHYLADTDMNSPSQRKGTVLFDKSADREGIQKHLQMCSVESVKELVHFVRSDCISTVESGVKREACTVLMARFLHGLCSLCPNLYKCLTLGHSDMAVSRGSQSAWREVCDIAQQESLSAWRIWCNLTSNKLRSMVQSNLQSNPRLVDMLHILPQWDVVTIEEEAEEGRSVRSDIKVPSQPSLPLQLLLSRVARELNGIAPHTLPRVVHQELMEALVSDLLDHFSNVASSELLYQAQALQALVDVRYLTMLLIPRDIRPLVTRSQDICDKLEDKIDPFDLDVFSPYVQTNIKRSVQRSQCLLGILVAWPEKLAMVAGLKVPGGSVGDPSVLPLCTSATWFPQLQVSGPVVQRPPATLPHTPAEKPQRKKLSSPKPKEDPSPGEMVRSGAAAWFGSMGSDWFSSG